MNTSDKLDAISEIEAQKILINADYMDKLKAIKEPVQAQIDALMATIQADIDALDAEYEPKSKALDDNRAKLEAEIRDEVIRAGVTVKGKYLQCVFAKGRVTWDSKVLDGLMIAVPQLAQARKEGQPSTSFRAVGS